MPQPETDYRALLVKYIRHVRQCEGVDYIEDGSQEGSDVPWAPGEWEALEAAAATARADQAAADGVWRKAHPPRPLMDPAPFPMITDVTIPVEYEETGPLQTHTFGGPEYEVERESSELWDALEAAYRTGSPIPLTATMGGEIIMGGEWKVARIGREPVTKDTTHMAAWLYDTTGREVQVSGDRRNPDA